MHRLLNFHDIWTTIESPKTQFWHFKPPANRTIGHLSQHTCVAGTSITQALHNQHRNATDAADAEHQNKTRPRNGGIRKSDDCTLSFPRPETKQHDPASWRSIKSYKASTSTHCKVDLTGKRRQCTCPVRYMTKNSGIRFPSTFVVPVKTCVLRTNGATPVDNNLWHAYATPRHSLRYHHHHAPKSVPGRKHLHVEVKLTGKRRQTACAIWYMADQ